VLLIVDFSLGSAFCTTLAFVYQPSFPVFFGSAALFSLFALLIQERFETVFVSKLSRSS
jgi:hypothetical protein